MTHIYFVRHAQPNYDNHDDLSRELTEKGMADRALVTKFLSDKNISCVYSSPFKRSVDTVADFAARGGCKIELVEDFRERKIDNVWIEDFSAFSRRQWEDFSYKLSDGESLREVQERNIRALEILLRKHAGGSVAVGSHGTALSTIINYYDPSFGYDDFERIRSLMPWIVRFSFEGERCVSIAQFDLFSGRVEEKTCAEDEISS